MLCALPAELLASVVASLPSVEEIGRLDRVCRLFHGPPFLICLSLKIRAAAAGEATEPPTGWEASQQSWLVFCERRRRIGGRQTIAAGNNHSLCLDASGDVHSSGSSRFLGHQVQPVGLGHGDGVVELSVLTRLSVLSGIKASSVAAGAAHSLVVTDIGRVYSFGRGHHGPLGHHDEDDAAFPWMQQDQHVPKLVDALRDVNVVAAAAGEYHSMALSDYGHVYSWGSGSDGCLGHGNQQSQYTPKLVDALHNEKIVAIAAGILHSVALTNAGRIYSFGEGSHGKLGHGDAQDQHTPKLVGSLCDVKVAAISARGEFNLALTDAGHVYSWGNGFGRRLGHSDEQDQLTPRLVETLHNERLVAVAAGNYHGLALTDTGCVYSWGHGICGVLGHGDEHDHAMPQRLNMLLDVKVVAVAAGFAHSMALTNTGHVYSWGRGTDGRESSTVRYGMQPELCACSGL